MNVARSTFVRRGYLLTALAVAVLLAASSGSAWAQTIGFSTSRGTLEEGASTANNTVGPLIAAITRTGNFDADDGVSDTEDQSFEAWVGENQETDHLTLEVVEYDGDTSPTNIANIFRFSVRSGDDTAATVITPGAAFGFRTEAARSDNVAIRIA